MDCADAPGVRATLAILLAALIAYTILCLVMGIGR
jgi:hypothetical protein